MFLVGKVVENLIVRFGFNISFVFGFNILGIMCLLGMVVRICYSLGFVNFFVRICSRYGFYIVFDLSV